MPFTNALRESRTRIFAHAPYGEALHRLTPCRDRLDQQVRHLGLAAHRGHDDRGALLPCARAMPAMISRTWFIAAADCNDVPPNLCMARGPRIAAGRAPSASVLSRRGLCVTRTRPRKACRPFQHSAKGYKTVWTGPCCSRISSGVAGCVGPEERDWKLYWACVHSVRQLFSPESGQRLTDH
jgi:hypothetical protein